MSEVEGTVRKYALRNAVQYSGRANAGSVIGKLMSELPELKEDPGKSVALIKRIVGEVNSLTIDEQKAELERTAPELLVRVEKEKATGLQGLPNVEGEVVLRFAPGPSGPLHIGHTRAAFLNDEYLRMYGGRYIIRLEDTNPMAVDPAAYDSIFEDLDWLDIGYTDRAVQSDRFQIYIDHAVKMLEGQGAYVCTCPVEEWRNLKQQGKPCPHREREPGEQLDDWDKMLQGPYTEGQASLMVKTDLEHPNPAVRDFVAMRIVDSPHPMTGDAFRVYPLYNFSVAIDDHLMGMTHVLRGKDHLNNTFRQQYVYRHFGWDEPEFIHYGWVSIEDTLLKTSLIRKGIRDGSYSGWDDVRLGTIKAMDRRGIEPEALRRYWIEVGVGEVDIRFSWKTLYAYNKQIIDPTAKRYFFVWHPSEMSIEGVDRLESNAPLHPDHRDWGTRNTVLEAGDSGIPVHVVREDVANASPGTRLRLKDLCNVKLDSPSRAQYIGNDLGVLKEGVGIIHWVPQEKGVKTTIYMPDGSLMEGYSEKAIRSHDGGVVQMERFGFVNVEIDGDKCFGWFCHR